MALLQHMTDFKCICIMLNYKYLQIKANDKV
jgi:hypothetical protein